MPRAVWQTLASINEMSAFQKFEVVSYLKSALTFVMHQFLGTWGVAMFAYYLGILTVDFMGVLRLPHAMRPLHWILTETPFFPVQIVLALYSGWYLSRRLEHKSMVWIWVLPGLILSWAVTTMAVQLSSVFALSGGAFSHYFGTGCRPKDHCLDQLLITMPFYTAIAYSVGARLGLRQVNSKLPTLAD
jgi:hypothetical protein